jgi:hypothetical protein
MEYYYMTHEKRAKIIKFEEYSVLYKEIESHNHGYQIIGIDGDKGTGKTNLSYHIGSHFIYNVINLDDFICKDQNCFVNAMNFGLLRHRIDVLSKPLVIEGVCLLEVLRRINMSADYLIYCREISENTNIWHDEDRLSLVDHDLLGNQLNDLQGLDVEITKYHYTFKPIEKANICYDIINQKKK